MNALTFKQRLAILTVGVVIPVVVAFQLSPVSQPAEYHDFADNRHLLGIPNFWNVISNFAFLVFGLIGLRRLAAEKESATQKDFIYHWGVFFLGVALVSVGSAYYHWAPDNATLVWDRLPMTLAFMSFFAFVIAERVNKTVGLILLPVFLLLGVGSVWYWEFTEAAGAGDLRLYGLVQFLPMVVVPLICFLFPKDDMEIKFLAFAFGWYALAKVLEHFDKEVFKLIGSQMGGHALKHLAASMAVYALYKYAFNVRRF